MFIGEVSRKTGLSIKAIRLYEELGLSKRHSAKGATESTNIQMWTFLT